MREAGSDPEEARRPRPGFAFGLGASVGALGGLVGLGGAEFRLPALVGALGLAPRDAVPVNLAASFVVLAASFPVRLAAVPMAEIAPHVPLILAMLAGSMSAAWIGVGVIRRLSDRLLARAILVLLVVLGLVLVAEGVLAQEPVRRVGDGAGAFAVAAGAGIAIGLVSSMLGVAGGELIIPTFILLFGIDAKLAGSMSILVGLPTIAIGLARWVRPGALLRDPSFLRRTLGPLALGSALGAMFGAALLGVVPAGALKIGLGLVLIWSALRVFGHAGASSEARRAGAAGAGGGGRRGGKG